MAVLGAVGKHEKKNFHQSVLDPNLLQAVRPSTEKGITIFRPIPEVSADGTIRPMILGDTPAGPDYSAIRIEQVVINSGLDSRFSGLAKPSDRPDAAEAEMPFPGLYIRLKGKLNRKDFEKGDPMKDRIEELFAGGMKAPLRQVSTMTMIQCVVFRLNDKELEKPASRQVLFLTSTAAEALNELFKEAHSKGIDVFSPETGCQIILEPEKQRGSDMKFFNATLGERIPLNVKTCQKLWVPWEKALRFHKYDDHLKALLAAFGRDIVEQAFSKREVARVLGEEFVAETKVTTTAAKESSGRTTTVTTPASTTPKGAVKELQIDIDGPPQTIDDEGEGPEEIQVPATEKAPSDANKAGNGTKLPTDPAALAAHYESVLGGDV
jgi:hypothetical protein